MLTKKRRFADLGTWLSAYGFGLFCGLTSSAGHWFEITLVVAVISVIVGVILQTIHSRAAEISDTSSK